MRKIVYVLIFAIIVLMFTACTAAKGSILIRENLAGTGCDIDFFKWSEQNKCEISLEKNDELSVEIACDSGCIALEIYDKNGAKAYAGNGLEAGNFIVEVPEAGEYVISIKGDKASGSIHIKKLV